MADPSPPVASMELLSDDLLRKVLCVLPFADRMQTVPLVCHTWRHIMADASMWPTVVVMPQLRGFTNEIFQSALLSVVPTATQLQQLQLERPSEFGLYNFDINELACITRLSSLTRLDAECIGTPVEQPALDNLFAGLPGLQHVRLRFETAAGIDWASDSSDEERPPRYRVRPDDFPRSLLRCTRLMHLDLFMYRVETHNTMFTVGGLPDGITALQRLQYLRLKDCVTAPLTRAISQLTQLTCMKILAGQLCYHDIRDPHELPLQALPSSLRVLEAASAPLNVMTHLTALLHLTLEEPVTNVAANTCSLSTLQALTSLQLPDIDGTQLHPFTGCTNLRALRLIGVEFPPPYLGGVLPLPFPELTRLRLRCGNQAMSEVLTMISEAPRLEVLELHYAQQTVDLELLGAAVVSQLPELRVVNLSGSKLSAHAVTVALHMKGLQRVPQEEYLPCSVVKQLMRLQQAAPRISWVLDDPKVLG